MAIPYDLFKIYQRHQNSFKMAVPKWQFQNGGAKTAVQNNGAKQRRRNNGARITAQNILHSFLKSGTFFFAEIRDNVYFHCCHSYKELCELAFFEFVLIEI